MMTQPIYGSPSDPMEADIDEEGVDRAQIREMLDLMPEQRLLVVQTFAESILKIRRPNGTRADAELLRRLAASEVEFIVVGMTAGVARGAPLVTFDPLEVVHRRSAENVARLLRVLAGLDAACRRDSGGLRPGESHLMSPGHQHLTTAWGDLDCLGTVGVGKTYEELLDQAPELGLGEGCSIRVVDLPTLIELEEQAGRPEDLAVLPVLRATLEESRGRG